MDNDGGGMSYKDILMSVNYKLKQHNTRQIKLDELHELLEEFNKTKEIKGKWKGGSLRLYGYWNKEHHFEEFVLRRIQETPRSTWVTPRALATAAFTTVASALAYKYVRGSKRKRRTRQKKSKRKV